jgi:GNAT superfamily N-acetyltransferase
MPEVGYQVRPLDESTWPDFARLVESQNGVWGGCWCMGFHPEGVGRGRTAEQNRADKQRRIAAGQAHAALVYEGNDCVGWCQFGPTPELPRIKHGKAYQIGLESLPDWRITCFYVHKKHRHRGVAVAALRGALAQIAALGGGTVETYPEVTEGRSPSSSFLHNGTAGMFEKAGFHRTRQLGKHTWILTRSIAANGPE